ncbi:MAG: hypothetical protein LBJ67_11410 [Planctomycetaceae bacterium]|nr:hypothetical protein [Planctomycetaceae bacterium]
MIAVVWMMRLRQNRFSAQKRRVIFLLRMFSVLFLLFAMLRPAMISTERTKLPASLVLLTDQSESMSISAQPDGRSRYDVACGTINASINVLNEISRQHELLPSAFDSSLIPLTYESHGIKFPDKADGTETAIGYALQQTLEQTAGKRLLGTILFTDGTQQTRTQPPYNLLPQEIASHFRDNGTPIFAVRLETSAESERLQNEIQDVVIQDLSVNDRVFLHNELLISGQIRVRGYANRPVPVCLLFETSPIQQPGQMTEAARQEYMADSSNSVVPFQFRYVPENAGLCKLTVFVPEQPKELTTTNNSLSQFVQVIDGGLNVLYIEGTWRHESTYLRTSLHASPDIRLDYIRVPIGKTGTLLERLQSPQNHYAAYILGDIDASAFTKEELTLIAEHVRNGAGLMMLGGFHAFGAGGYAGTPLAEVCPIEMTILDRQPLNAEIRNDLHVWNDVRLQSSPQFQSHYLLQLAPDSRGNVSANDKVWQSLPPLLGANRIRAKQTAQILAYAVPVHSVLTESPIWENGNFANFSRETTPLLVTQNYGSGRVLAFTADSTWRWQTRGYTAEHQRFWRQMILWLAKSDDLPGGECRIELEKTRFAPGENVTFRVRAKAKNGAEIFRPNATVSIQMPDGTEQSISLTDANGAMTGTFHATQTSGDYRINASIQMETKRNERQPEESVASITKESVKTTTARFLVTDRNSEFDNPASSPMVLENLTTMTGGKMIMPEDFPQLLRELAQHADTLVEQRETKKTLYDTWTFLILFTMLLSIEWFLRKRWGAV